MNIRANIDQNLEIDPIEAALMDIARALQLTPTMHREAEQRYGALSKHVDRRGSPLEDQVDDVYPSGSFAIHAATRSEVERDMHDVDAVLEIRVAEYENPDSVLSSLYEAIKGEEGSQYYNFTIDRHSRCITVTYSDGVTVDLMPVARIQGTPDRVANLFHYNSEKNESYTKEVNPKGFANHFNQRLELSAEFAKRFDTRRLRVEGATYAEQLVRDMGEDARVLAERAETEAMPSYLPLDQKSPRLVALQLLKRFRDKRFRKHDDHKGMRKPPSVVMAALALTAGPLQPTLTDELIAIATSIRNAIVAADRIGQLVEVRNPAHQPDIFTDRWPENRNNQRVWAADLAHLIGELSDLRTSGFDPVAIRRVFGNLFGVRIADRVIEEHFQVFNDNILGRKMSMTPKGTLHSPSMPTRSPLAAPAIIGSSAASSLITPARANTSMGGEICDDAD